MSSGRSIYRTIGLLDIIQPNSTFDKREIQKLFTNKGSPKLTYHLSCKSWVFHLCIALVHIFHILYLTEYTHYHWMRGSVGISCMVQYSGRLQIDLHHNIRHCIQCMAASPQAFHWYVCFWQCCAVHCALQRNALVVQLCLEQFPIVLCLRQNALSVSTECWQYHIENRNMPTFKTHGCFYGCKLRF